MSFIEVNAEGVMIARVDVIQIPHIGGSRLVSPAGPAQKEIQLRQVGCRFEKELFHTLLPIRKPIG